jgi:hypothetical protein
VAFWTGLGNSIFHLRTNQRIVFDNPKVNEGNAYNRTTGVFTSPVDGTYMFFLAVAHVPPRVGQGIYKNGLLMKNSIPQDGEGAEMTSIMLTLAAGDVVWVDHLADMGHFLYGEDYTNFSGFLLHETVQ